jgi:RND family efflux transporter MFP subunit
MKGFFQKNIIAISIAVIVIVGGLGYWYVKSSSAPVFGQTTVGKGNVVESVSNPGNVLAENNAAVSFQEGGQIASVNVSEGSVVSAGTVLATLNTSQLSSAVQQANAAVATAQANLAEIASGTRPEQLQIDQSAVASANQSLGIAVENAYGASDDAVENQLDNLFSNPRSNNPTFLVPSSDSQTVNTIASDRVSIGVSLAAWYAALNSTSSATVDPATLAGTASTILQQIDSYVNSISLVVNEASANGSVSAATLAQYKADVATARGEIEASISAVSGAQSALTAAQNTLILAQAGSTPQQIAAQQAVVQQAEAGVTSAQVALNNASLIAPFSGTVQNLTAQIGQVVSPGTPILSLVNNSGLKIETYVSEADVAKIAVGDKANVTLDAFGTGTVFPATVSTVDAAETQVNGSPAYEVTLHFTSPNSSIKDGMSGNVQIIAAEHDNVVEVPSNLVINNNGNYFVLVQNGNTTKEAPVQIGLVGDNGMTEITSGLNVGDNITNF